MSADDPWDFDDTVDFLANTVSLLACVVVLVRVHFIDARLRQRLFLRQMVALAAADGLYHLKHTLHYTLATVAMSLGLDPRHQGAILCTFYPVSGRFFLTASAAITTHVGLTFAFQSLRKPGALALMSKSLPACWLLAALIATADTIQHGVTGAWCPLSWTNSLRWEAVSYPYGIVMILASIVNLTASVLTVCASRGCSDATIKRLMRRVGALPVSCLMTQLPAAVLAFNAAPNDTFKDFARLSMHLNGFANVLAFALQSRYMPHLIGRALEEVQPDFVRHKGRISQGGTLLREVTTVEAAKRRALELEGCQGFCFKDADAEEVEVVFKSKWDVHQSPDAWTAYKIVRHVQQTDELRAQPERAERHSFHPCFGPGNHVQVEVLLIPNGKALFGPPETDMPHVPADFAF